MNGSPNIRNKKQKSRKNRVEHYLEEYNEENSRIENNNGISDEASMVMSQLDLSQIAAEGGGYNAIAKRMSDKYDGRIKATNKEIANLREKNTEYQRMSKIAKKKLDANEEEHIEFQKKIVEQTERQNNLINGQHSQILKFKSKIGYLILNCRQADKHIKDFDVCYDEDAKATMLYVEKKLKDKKTGKDR